MVDEGGLREKYRAERDKRLQADGSRQYIEPIGTFAHYLDDPYVRPTPREPLFDAGRRGVRNSMGYPEGPVAYFRYIDAWRNSGDFAGLEFR